MKHADCEVNININGDTINRFENILICKYFIYENKLCVKLGVDKYMNFPSCNICTGFNSMEVIPVKKIDFNVEI